MPENFHRPQGNQPSWFSAPPAGVTEEASCARSVECIGGRECRTARGARPDLKPHTGPLQQPRLEGQENRESRPALKEVQQVGQSCVEPGLRFMLRRHATDKFRCVNRRRVSVEVFTDIPVNRDSLSLGEHVQSATGCEHYLCPGKWFEMTAHTAARLPNPASDAVEATMVRREHGENAIGLTYIAP